MQGHGRGRPSGITVAPWRGWGVVSLVEDSSAPKGSDILMFGPFPLCVINQHLCHARRFAWNRLRAKDFVRHDQQNMPHKISVDTNGFTCYNALTLTKQSNTK